MQLSCQFLMHAFLATSSPSPPKCYEVIVISEDKNISSVAAKISSYGEIGFLQSILCIVLTSGLRCLCFKNTSRSVSYKAKIVLLAMIRKGKEVPVQC